MYPLDYTNQNDMLLRNAIDSKYPTNKIPTLRSNQK